MPNSLKNLLIFICMLTPFSVTSQETNEMDKLSCYTRHLDTDEIVEVKTVSGLAGSKIATAQWPLGYPTIVIDDSAFTKLPDNAKKFIYYHECAHLTLLTKNENEADCESIKTMTEKHGLTELDIRILVKTLVKKFGLSRRWTNLLMCEGVIE